LGILRLLFSEPFFVVLIGGTLTASTPIILAAVGEDFVESGGVLNLGLEGMLLLGSFCAFIAALLTENICLGLLAGMAAGVIVGLVFGYLVISLKVNQIVAGLGIELFVVGLTSLLYRVLFGNTFPVVPEITSKTAVPFFSSLPYVSSIFNQHLVTYISWALLPIAWWVLYRTNFGLNVRAVGESPAAADAHGINVYRTRYMTIIFEGVLAGLGGAFLSICDLAFFVFHMTQGRGFIAIAIVMLAKRNPAKLFYWAFLFGICQSLTFGLQILGLDVPREFILMLPYVAVIVLLCFLARNTRLPGAFCTPYERE